MESSRRAGSSLVVFAAECRSTARLHSFRTSTRKLGLSRQSAATEAGSLKRRPPVAGSESTWITPTGGTPVDIFAPAVGSDDNDFFVARAKLNFKFGTY